METRQDLINYIKGMLGEPIINVEISDFQINENIDFAIKKFSEFAMYGRLKQPLLIEMPDSNETYQFLKLDTRVSEVITVRVDGSGGGMLGLNLPGGLVVTPSEVRVAAFGSAQNLNTYNPLDNNVSTTNVFAILAKMSIIDTIFTIIPNYSFNPYTKILTFFEKIYSKRIIIEARLEYMPKQQDAIYDQIWVKAYSLSLCKKTWGNNLGKYDALLIGGSKVNYERIIQEAQTELEALETDLLDKYGEPLPIIRG